MRTWKCSVSKEVMDELRRLSESVNDEDLSRVESLVDSIMREKYDDARLNAWARSILATHDSDLLILFARFDPCSPDSDALGQARAVASALVRDVDAMLCWSCPDKHRVDYRPGVDDSFRAEVEVRMRNGATFSAWAEDSTYGRALLRALLFAMFVVENDADGWRGVTESREQGKGVNK